MQPQRNVPRTARGSKNPKAQDKKFYPPAKPVPEKRLTVEDLKAELSAWDKGLTECAQMHLIACGSTALTLLGYKKELANPVEILVPDKKEYGQLILFLKQIKFTPVSNAGWKRPNLPLIFNLYSGNKIYSAELLNSPLQNSSNKKIEQMSKIYLGVLNSIDLIISRMFRGNESDLQDCLTLLKRENISVLQLKKRYKETALYDLAEARYLKNLDRLLASVPAF